MLAHRNLKKIFTAIFERRHYRALFNMLRHYENPNQLLYSYLTGKGAFPRSVKVSSPLGTLVLTLYNFHDLLTLNEIFCRKDYDADHLENLSCVVDLGSNIGISASYFLSRNDKVKVYAFEPVPTNLTKLKAQIASNGFTDRIEIHEMAVSDFSGYASFGIESSGRYGGIGLTCAETIEVPVQDINHILGKILQKEERINILKIDTEGSEKKIIEAIHPQFAKKIDLIYAESLDIAASATSSFITSQSGTILTYSARKKLT